MTNPVIRDRSQRSVIIFTILICGVFACVPLWWWERSEVSADPALRQALVALTERVEALEARLPTESDPSTVIPADVEHGPVREGVGQDVPEFAECIQDFERRLADVESAVADGGREQLVETRQRRVRQGSAGVEEHVALYVRRYGLTVQESDSLRGLLLEFLDHDRSVVQRWRSGASLADLRRIVERDDEDYFRRLAELMRGRAHPKFERTVSLHGRIFFRR